MTTTVTYRITSEWTEVASGAENVTMAGPAFAYEVYIGASAPAATDMGIPATDATGVSAWLGLDSGADKVYARTRLNQNSVGGVALTVMAS